MKVKLLSIELEYDSDEEDFNINIKYGKILEHEDFADLKEDTYKLKDEIVKVIQEKIEEED